LDVVQIITRLNTGGAARAVTSLIPLLDGKQSLIFGRTEPDEGDMSFLTNGLDCEVVFCERLHRSISLKDDFAAYRAIGDTLRKLKPDIVHTHLSKAGFVGRKAAWDAGIRWTVHTYHGNIFEGHFSRTKGYLFRVIEKRLAKRTSRLVAVSETLKERLCRLIGGHGRWSVIPPPVTPLPAESRSRQEARKVFGIEENARVLGFIGRLVPVKNPLFLVDVLKMLGGDWVLLVAGDGQLRGEMEKAASRAGIFERVRFAGWVREIADFYSAVDVLALASKTEGFGLSVVEALSADTPVVALAATGVVDVLDAPLRSESAHLKVDGGYVVYTPSASEFAECVEQAEAERESLNIGRAFQRIMESCSIERVAERYNSLYRELMRG